MWQNNILTLYPESPIPHLMSETERRPAMFYVYRKTFFEHSLKEAAKAYLAALPKDITCLLTMGSSGCSIASAMIALTDKVELHHVYVKKEGEYSHCNTGGNFEPGDKIAIVDDFIDTGTTVEKLMKFAEARGRIVECVITVLSYREDIEQTFKVKHIVVEVMR